MSSITRALQTLVDIRKAKGLPIEAAFQPGVSRSNIDRLTVHLPFRLPDELYTVYQWRNGIADESEFYFLFSFTLSSSHELGKMDSCLRRNDTPCIPVIPAKAGIHASDNTVT